MNYSWKLGRLCGIDIRLHWSFLIVPAWVASTSLAAGAGLASAVNATFFVLAIFGCVLLHEMGHALAARRYGIATRDITLLPIGGLARLEGMTESPRQELAIALAGPAVNVAIAGALWLGLLLRGNMTLPFSLVHRDRPVCLHNSLQSISAWRSSTCCRPSRWTADESCGQYWLRLSPMSEPPKWPRDGAGIGDLPGGTWALRKPKLVANCLVCVPGSS